VSAAAESAVVAAAPTLRTTNVLLAGWPRVPKSQGGVAPPVQPSQSEIVTCARVVPCPASGFDSAGRAPSPSAYVTSTVPFAGLVPLGVNVTLNVQRSPGARPELQPLLAIEN